MIVDTNFRGCPYFGVGEWDGVHFENHITERLVLSNLQLVGNTLHAQCSLLPTKDIIFFYVYCLFLVMGLVWLAINKSYINFRFKKEPCRYQCCVCLDEYPKLVTFRCNHTCTCETCAVRLDKCPFCRSLISNLPEIPNRYPRNF